MTERRLEQIRAVSFDVGGTLISPRPSVGAIYEEIATDFGYAGLSPDTLNAQFTAAWNRHKGHDYSLSAWAKIVNQSFAGLIPVPISKPFFARLYQAFSDVHRWHLYEDVLPCLNHLKARGIPQVVISNWDNRLPPLLVDLGLSSYFDAIFVSGCEGFQKPDSRIFSRAAQALDLCADSILHIGDSQNEDVKGAEEAGFMALLLDRNNSTSITENRIHSLHELSRMIVTISKT